MLSPVLMCAFLGRGHGVAGGGGGGGGGGVRAQEPPPPEAAGVQLQRGEGQLVLVLNALQACRRYRSQSGWGCIWSAHAVVLITPSVLKPPQPRVLSQQASSSATLRFLVRVVHEGCGFTSNRPQSNFANLVYIVSLDTAADSECSCTSTSASTIVVGAIAPSTPRLLVVEGVDWLTFRRSSC